MTEQIVIPTTLTPQQLTANPWAKFEDKADPTIPTATYEIYNYINDYLGARDESEVNVNRASAATMCPKRRQYQHKGVKGEPLTPRKLVNFLLGDLSERTMLYFVRMANVGEGKIYSEVDLGKEIGAIHFQGKELMLYEQQELYFSLPDGTRITAHIDGFGKRRVDGQWELIECKSSANWGFKEFQTDGVGDYIKQSHACMLTGKAQSLGVKNVRYFYLRKETGHLWDRSFPYDKAIALEVMKEYQEVLAEKEITKPFNPTPEMTGRSPNKRPTGRKILDFPCTYCPYKENCQGKVTMEWKDDQWGNQKPTFVVA